MGEVFKFLDDYLTGEVTVVCATSGGVDSMCLLNILLKYNNIKIICAHVNHNLREESFEEYEFVKKFCNKNNIVFEGITLDKINKGNLEYEFRNMRYDFFENIVNKYNAKYLLTAHHGDDLIETILMKIVRGSSINGYGGFDKVSMRSGYSILRPLIFTTKDALYKYAMDNNIEYREDKTNNCDDYTRNRYRKYILPRLKEENINVHKKFIKFSEEISNSNKFINEYVDNLFSTCVKSGVIDLKNIPDNDFILRKIIYRYLSDVYKNNIILINDNNINEIIKIIKSNRPNLCVDLPLKIRIIKKYNYLQIDNASDLKNYKYELKDEVELGLGMIKKIESTKLTNNYICHLNSNDIKLPLYVRNRRNGDLIEVLGLNGRKKIKDIYIDSKIPKNIRDEYPIVVDSDDNILWLPGIKKSKYDRLKDGNYDIILWYTRRK